MRRACGLVAGDVSAVPFEGNPVCFHLRVHESTLTVVGAFSTGPCMVRMVWLRCQTCLALINTPERHDVLVAARQVVLEEEDEVAVRAWVEQRRSFVKRLPDAAAPDRPSIAANGSESLADGNLASSSASAAQAAAPTKPVAAASSNIGFGKASLGAVVRKRKAEAPPIAAGIVVKKQEPAAERKEEQEAAPGGLGAANGDAGSDDGSTGGLAGLGEYGSSGSDSPRTKAE